MLNEPLDDEESGPWNEGSKDTALANLKDAATKFKSDYEEFAKGHEGVVVVRQQVHAAIEIAVEEEDIALSAKLFGEEINLALRALNAKKENFAGNWTGRLGSFVTKLYPLARFIIQSAGAVSKVSSMYWPVSQ